MTSHQNMPGHSRQGRVRNVTKGTCIDYFYTSIYSLGSGSVINQMQKARGLIHQGNWTLSQTQNTRSCLRTWRAQGEPSPSAVTCSAMSIKRSTWYYCPSRRNRGVTWTATWPGKEGRKCSIACKLFSHFTCLITHIGSSALKALACYKKVYSTLIREVPGIKLLIDDPSCGSILKRALKKVSICTYIGTSGIVWATVRSMKPWVKREAATPHNCEKNYQHMSFWIQGSTSCNLPWMEAQQRQNLGSTTPNSLDTSVQSSLQPNIGRMLKSRWF